jgi:hypothetical protein
VDNKYFQQKNGPTIESSNIAHHYHHFHGEFLEAGSCLSTIQSSAVVNM